MLPKDDASTHVALAARCLAQEANHFGKTARAEATDLAMQFLVWPLDGAKVDCARIVIDCEQILTISAAIPMGPRESSAERPGRDTTEKVPQRHATPQHEVSIARPGTFATEDLPGGDLPIEIVEIPSLPPSLVPPSS